ncbi:Metallophosphoesterase 1 [Phytophthora cinnamomi]|uniref:Metallophosphoesterase 1 n=1 Tax=Phytophthora cinnamomi TaxID=4785 RepID=UPI003559CACB|nr:Metallophosphoesterase 1 [Phytophthora cinnamomi]
MNNIPYITSTINHNGAVAAGASRGGGAAVPSGLLLPAGVALRAAVPADGGDITVLVVTDVHLLGKRRRSLVERLWVDWQVRARPPGPPWTMHGPQVALVLGDQFDEGSRWTPDALGRVGNHDTSFGREMRIEDLKRYEVTFGAANRIDEIEDIPS